MEKHNISVPEYLVFKDTIDFINSFKLLKGQRIYVFDFKNLRRIDPFSILLLNSELDILKKIILIVNLSQKISNIVHMQLIWIFSIIWSKFW
ncbi:hypothetical protein SY27_13815 [Flavobacterium sp. 316]|nr:hypothetical protein SY27_13815 [Flavobacterium sp. 316]